MHWKKIAIVGVGLLGGSLGMAVRQRRLADCVSGFVRREASISECQSSGAVDVATCDLSLAVAGAQLIVLCTPLGQMRSLARQMLANLAPGAIVTDVGSVKTGPVRELEGMIAKAHGYFVGSHPMAGAERSGVAAARPDLFKDAICVVTPTRYTNRVALRKVESLWKGVDARVLRLTPEIHDDLVSRSSHLPHVLAAQLANFVLRPDSPKEQAALCANGFRDTTRIASGSPEMWRDIALANRRNLARVLTLYIDELDGFKRALKKRDAAAISRFFERAKARRDAWTQMGGRSSPE